MFFCFIRRWQRRIIICLLLVIFVLVMKQKHPQLGQTVGEWISGSKDTRIARAVSSMMDSLSEGEDLKTAVEVFREGWSSAE